MSGVILVRDAMAKAIKSVRPTSSAHEAIEKMIKFNIGSILVMDGEKLHGIITERDILQRVAEQSIDARSLQAKDIMSRPVVTVDENITLEEAARMMSKKNIKKLVATREGKVVGVITTTDIVRRSPQLIEFISKPK
ncbi:MAG: CBS domain-containing protein [Candidatus Atabeyarchaeum deiterrae]